MIHFKLQEDDIKAFAKRVLELPLTQGLAFKKILLISRVGFFFFIVGAYLHWAYGTANPWIYAAIYLLSCVLICMPLFVKHYFIPRQTLNIYKKVFSNHKDGVSYTVRADVNSLYFKTPRSESTLKWGPEIKIYEDTKYILIFIDPQQALIINRHKVEGDLNTLIKVVKEQLKNFEN